MAARIASSTTDSPALGRQLNFPQSGPSLADNLKRKQHAMMRSSHGAGRSADLL